MKHARSQHSAENGFTLIEIIATVVVMGILAAFLMNFMGTALNDSWRSVELVADEARAEGLLEKIIADYVDKINDNPNTALAAIKGLESSYENDADYGLPVTIQYIVFDAGNEDLVEPTPSRNLKIVIESSGYSLAAILSESRTDSDHPRVIY